MSIQMMRIYGPIDELPYELSTGTIFDSSLVDEGYLNRDGEPAIIIHKHLSSCHLSIDRKFQRDEGKHVRHNSHIVHLENPAPRYIATMTK